MSRAPRSDMLVSGARGECVCRYSDAVLTLISTIEDCVAIEGRGPIAVLDAFNDSVLALLRPGLLIEIGGPTGGVLRTRIVGVETLVGATWVFG